MFEEVVDLVIDLERPVIVKEIGIEPFHSHNRIVLQLTTGDYGSACSWCRCDGNALRQRQSSAFYSVAVGVLALILVATSLADWRDLAPVYRPVSVALGVAAVVAILLGWLAPPPWLQILLLTLVLGAVWLYGILTWFSFTHHDGASPAEARPRLRSARRPWRSRRRRPPDGPAADVR